MTTEEKARAYDEALEVMRQWIAPCHTKEQLDTLKKSVFPELAESEDERIRKFLITIVNNLSAPNFKDAEKKNALAYLEKQKEQKPEKNTATINGEPIPTENHSVDIPLAEWSEEDKRAIDRACVALRAYANGDLPEFLPSELIGYADRLQSLRPNQPKSEWSEEDERMFSRCIKSIETSKQFADSGTLKAAKDKEIAWLKSLCSQPQGIY